jgi:hypothetical protein
MLAPSAFMRRIISNRPVYFNEKYPFFEDHPMWMMLTGSGVRLHYFDKFTVVYQQEASISRVEDKCWSINHYNSLRDHYFEERRKFVSGKKLLLKHLAFFGLQDILVKLFKNKKSYLAKKFNSVFLPLFRPVSP